MEWDRVLWGTGRQNVANATVCLPPASCRVPILMQTESSQRRLSIVQTSAKPPKQDAVTFPIRRTAEGHHSSASCGPPASTSEMESIARAAARLGIPDPLPRVEILPRTVHEQLMSPRTAFMSPLQCGGLHHGGLQWRTLQTAASHWGTLGTAGLHCDAALCSVPHCNVPVRSVPHRDLVVCSVSQCEAAFSNVLHCNFAVCSAGQCKPAVPSVPQCDAAVCSVLHSNPP